MNHPSAYRNQEVVIIGLAKSGRAVAEIFHRYGARVTVNDVKGRHLCPEADGLEKQGITVICGHHPAELIHPGVSLVVKNPGVPYHAKPIQQALNLGIELVTEVEVAYHLSNANIIGITGSNGKTTTTTWVGNILAAAGLSPIVAGNIGTPLCEAAMQAADGQWMVVELSSFQLKGTSRFRPRVSCLLNVTETHLDYHGTIDDYITSKEQLFRHQTADDIAVLNRDDPICRQIESRIRCQVIPFSMKERLDYGVYVLQGQSGQTSGEEWIVYRDRDGIEHPVVATQELNVPGRHNVENALAATAIALAVGVQLSTIQQQLRSFQGVEHRLEHVSHLLGISFYNDSKATNSEATMKALQAFEQRVILICGGMDRGQDFNELGSWFQRKLKGLVVFGETKEKLKSIGESAGVPFISCIDHDLSAKQVMDLAVRQAFSVAQPGDVILLSPACASWDMFTSFEERGRMFKESVHNLV